MIGAIGVNEETFGTEGSVDQTRDCGRIGSFGGYASADSAPKRFSFRTSIHVVDTLS
jgi:hypothetical protein